MRQASRVLWGDILHVRHERLAQKPMILNYPTPRPFYESAVADKVLRKDRYRARTAGAKAALHKTMIVALARKLPIAL